MEESKPKDDFVLLHLSHRPSSIINGVISVHNLMKVAPTAVHQKRQLPLGQLESLPLEILHESFKYLDLRSISRLSRVSVRSRSIVDSVPEYRDLAKSAAHTFEILGQAKILGLHSVGTLHAALRSDRCSSCGAHGAFLHIISAKRCCFLCLVANQSLWMISLPLVRECFGLSKRQRNALPTLWSIPGRYCVPHKVSRQKSIRLTSVQLSKELAIKKYGSLSELEKRHPLDPLSFSTTAKYELLTWYRQAPLQPLPQDPRTITLSKERPRDKFCGMGAIPFPSLIKGRLEQGVWCRGCEYTYNEYASQQLDQDIIPRLVPQGCNAIMFLLRTQYVSWTRAELLEHAEVCSSAGAVIAQKWIGMA